MGPSSPSRDMHYAMQANPDLPASDPGLIEEFEAAPWLLPPRTAALPYAGVHDFDELLKLRSRPAGNYSSSVALLLFSKPYAVMLQNSVYSLVKHGGVRNYIALAWSAEDLEACADLNLPCADVSSMLVEPIQTSQRLLQHDFLVMMWVKPAAVLRALRQGHAVMFVDTDVAYAVKPLWESYMAFMERVEADGAWQSESPVNSGHFVVLPTPAGLAFAEAWAAAAPSAIPKKVSEQKGLQPLERAAYVTCRLPCLCYRHKYELLAQGKRDSMAVFAVYLPSFFPYTSAGCTVGSKEWLPSVDPCDWTTLYLHPICVSGAANKEAIFKSIGYWFMDNEKGCLPQRGAASGVPACRPLHWRVPDTERRHYSCPSYGLGLVHGELPPAIQALRAGASADEARALLVASTDKECNGKNGPLQF
ncbi:hypothetical protein C2E20_4222 [Micractinium conductrix]|uniref:Nucleotide-diphospho-sugar transferase domain-containing protein n=1 Tax=Micractinium conductrix TaxID=554055 RepID=A0A2P6VER4_9CHLO|nr:hypothetical protein C2E20_4222 [Micractinium conductrix]|eukprot:PSC72584.1 hypothetical protein C2E20_4222 [Micractinium conductrix]